jgi:hypothetical protein
MFLSIRVFFMLFQHVINFPFRFVPVPSVRIQSYFFFLAYIVDIKQPILFYSWISYFHHSIVKKK